MLIFHSVRPIRSEGGGYTSGSTIRPKRMLSAFEALGVPLSLVDGCSTDREEKWKHALKLNGIMGVYSELSTMPIALTDADHFPRRPFMDARHFRALSRKGIPCSAFYRDIHWRFPQYSQSVSAGKRSVSAVFYFLELLQLSYSVDHVFLPSAAMLQHVPLLDGKVSVSELPPGGDIRSPAAKPKSGALNLFYVGGVTPPLYDLRPMLAAVQAVQGVTLTLCCREEEWQRVRGLYGDVGANITVVHKSGADIESYFAHADAFLMWWPRFEYLEFAMPVKLFETIGWGLPVIASPNAEIAKLIAGNGLGWTPETEIELAGLLRTLRDNRMLLKDVARNSQRVRENHTWEARARTVVSTLEAIRARK